MEPKFILVFEANSAYPYAIYEQMASYILTPKQKTQLVHREPPQIAQRIYSRHDQINVALSELYRLNDNQPVLIAYSTKPIDNTFSV